ncbi:MAG: Smr/MutS family protein [Chloroflexota bacterium]|nr:Smr/MutS family protein [Chloroflexota bacterium]
MDTTDSQPTDDSLASRDAAGGLRARSLALLEFPAVLEQLASHAGFVLGRREALALTPSSDAVTVAERQRETAEARLFLESGGVMEFGEAGDVSVEVQRAAKGGILTGLELRAVAETLRAGRLARGAFLRRDNACPALAAMARNIPDMDAREASIFRAIGVDGQVEDAASPTLRELRSQARVAYGRLEDTLQRLVRSDRTRRVLQEPLVTERNGRLVVPVRIEMRSRMPGLVHDVSGSGETIFVEPLAAVSLGNQWRELKLAETREEERVLRELSLSIGDYADEIDLTQGLLARLDAVLAKGRYALALSAHPAATADEGLQDVRLAGARHPLLRGHVVPLSLELGHVGQQPVRPEPVEGQDERASEQRIMLITGPNGGGKTVALKTLGLLALMHQAGLQTPAEPGTVLPIFDAVYADIGDQQSIEQSLSTFTSHMTSVRGILSQATPRSLALMDELGSSTDPEEGAALAEAVLQSLLDIGVTTIATTHLRRVAAFVQETPGMVNASVELDPETFAPTYGLTVGLPGRSYALTIAERVGLPHGVVERAQGMLSPEHHRVEELLAEVVEERQAAADVRAESEAALAEAQEVRRQAEAELERLRELRVEQMETARHDLQAQAEELMGRLKAAERALVNTPDAPRTEAIAEVQQAVASVQSVRRGLRAPRWRPRREDRAEWLHSLGPGDTVRVRGFPGAAQVMATPDERGMVEVAVGVLRAQVPLDHVLHRDPAAAQAAAASTKRRYTKKGPAMPAPEPAGESPGLTALQQLPAAQLDLRGMRVDEALDRLPPFLDRALQDGHARVRVVHGIGTGALRAAVRDWLHSSTMVSRWQPAEGRTAEGATDVDLA